MTVAEMHILCDEILDKSNAPWFNAIQKDIYLNLAQEEYVEKSPLIHSEEISEL
jgi:hypothetical protein